MGPHPTRKKGSREDGMKDFTYVSGALMGASLMLLNWSLVTLFFNNTRPANLIGSTIVICLLVQVHRLRVTR